MELEYSTVEDELGEMMVSEEAMELPCPTCLTFGRALSPLREAARAYCMLLAGLRQEDVEELVTYTMLCWECNRFVERMLRFQEQVLHSNILMRAYVPDQTEKDIKTYSPLCSVIKTGFDCELQHEDLTSEWEVPVPDSILEDVEEAKVLLKDENADTQRRQRRKRTLKAEVPQRKSARRPVAKVKSAEPGETEESPRREGRRGTKRSLARTIGSWPGQKVLLKGRKKNVKIVSMMMPEEEMLSSREEDRKGELFIQQPYRCDYCIKGFKFVNLLERHNTSVHSQEAGSFICGICRCCFPSEEQLLRHHKKHYHLYVCVACGYSHRILSNVFRHYTNVHESGKAFPCDRCMETFPSARKMRYHREITHKASYKCEYCGKVMRNAQSFKSHLLIHTGMPMLECSICKKSCRGDSGLYAHMRSHHSQENAEVSYCAECDIQFKNKAIYRSHLKTSIKHATPAQLKYNCTKCEKKFISETAVKQHVRYYHMEYICNVCGKRLNNWYSLDKHVKFVHEKREMPRKHMCETCGKGFKTKRALESHLMTHTGERPYWCDICSSTFAQKSTLRTHRRLVHFKIKNPPAPPAVQ